MCIGGQPKAPDIKYVGPSDEDIARNQQQLTLFEEAISKQQAETAAAIQSQIDAANEQTAKLQSQYDKEIAAATADASAAAASANNSANYAVTATQTEAPSAQVTQKIKAKKKPKSTLKISPSAVAQAGSGLNIGV